MSKIISRKSMTITVFALLGVSLAVLWPGWRAELRALGYYPVIVILNGELTVVETQPELTLRMTAQVSSGRAPGSSILYGSGSASVLHGDGRPEEGPSQFDLSGWVTAEGMVSLTGQVVKARDPALIGQRVSITASEQTGDIVMTYGELILFGTGKIIIR